LVSTPSADDWKSRYTPIADWDRMFADGRWDYLDSPSEAPRYAVIAGYIHRRPDAACVLDVGCGSGLLYRYLDQSRVTYRGIDVSPTAIGQARERFPRAQFDVADIGATIRLPERPSMLSYSTRSCRMLKIRSDR
jgi:SAM-dependent methyltransferase